MRVKIINEKSPYFNAVLTLGDLNRGTLGFLPTQAFEEYARKKHILIMIDDSNTLVGYILFRFKGSALIIVQLCVNPAFRKLGYAKRLIDELMDMEKNTISHMQLACRRDYNLSSFWSSLGFYPVSEKDGRSTKQSTILTIWTRQNPNCENLFTMDSYEGKDKTITVLDTNIVIDLCNGKHNETENLLLDYIGNYAQFKISKDVLVEIDQNTEVSIREQSRKYAITHFDIISCDDQLYSSVMNSILQRRPASKHSNTWFDISHISCAISSGANVYITRDSAWISSDISLWIQKEFGILILSPGEFIKHIDEIDSPEDYAPQKLFGLNMTIGEMKAEDYSAVVDCFYHQFEKKSQFEEQLRAKMSDPQRFHIQVIRLGCEIASIAFVEYEENKANVSLLLINNSVLKESLFVTFVKWFSFRIIDSARKNGNTQVVFHSQNMETRIQNVLLECGFLRDNGTLFRVIISCVTTRDEFERAIFNEYIKDKSIDSNAFWNTRIEIFFEKTFWPLKISPSSIPCYIVPITAEYAMELFDEALWDMNPSFFDNEKITPALSPQKVYFKGKSQSISESPAHILWYVSKSNKYLETGMIRACSILDTTETGKRKDLFRKYQRLGVLDWSSLQRFGKNEDDISAYAFSFTELFRYPIPLYAVKEIMCRPNETFQSFRRIRQDDFIKLYRKGAYNE